MRRIGRYEIGELLGEGGAGSVYSAVLVGPGGLRKPVALKVLREGGEALRREARLGGLLRHRNLVDVYEVGEHEGRWFCAMELCDGVLSEWMPLPPRAVVEAGLQVCAALHYAHRELGLVHLDIKPSNLLLANGVVKVADLGIARAEGFPVDPRIRGTPAYMPPEQWGGGAVDARADVWALGVTLSELATGRLPSRATATLDMDSLDEPVEEGDSLAFGPVPRWLAPVVDRCLEPNRSQRWPDMGALREALRTLKAPGAHFVWPLTRRPTEVARDDRGRFFGRSDALREVHEGLRVPGARLALKGPAGVGKTRLAVEALPPGARVCDLSSARTKDEVVAALARLLGLEAGTGDPLAAVGAALASHDDIVVVLDHVDRVEAAAEIVDGLAELAPTARFVATSRVALALPTVDVGGLTAAAARALVVDRARRRGAEVADDPDLDELVRRLDGLPLALELAAGRLGVLTVAELLERFGVSLLRSSTDDQRGALRAALDASWDGLDEPGRTTLAALSAFAGAFTVEAAEEVVGGSILDRLQALVDRSMISPHAGGRFRLSHTMRDFAARHLHDPDVELRHGAWFARYGTVERMDEVEGAAGRPVVQQRAIELDDVVVACRRAIARGDARIAVMTLRGAWTLWYTSGPFSLAAELAEQVCGLGGSPDVAAMAHHVAAHATHVLGRSDAADAHYAAALDALAKHPQPALELRVVNNLGGLRRQLGRAHEARALYERGLAIARRLGDRRVIAESLSRLGPLYRVQGRHEQAEAAYRDALEIVRADDNVRLEGLLLGNLAVLYRASGRPERAIEAYEAAIACARRTGNRKTEGVQLANLGVALSGRGDLQRARDCYEEALAIHREVGNRRYEGIAIGNLADLARGQGDLDAARVGYALARDIAAEVSDLRFEASWAAQLARVAAEPDLVALDAAEAALRGVDDPSTLAMVLLVRAELVLRAGDVDGATRHIDEALAIAGEHPDVRSEAEALLATRPTP